MVQGQQPEVRTAPERPRNKSAQPEKNVSGTGSDRNQVFLQASTTNGPKEKRRCSGRRAQGA
eukprot:3205934-Rhodomonas_salina.2